MNKNVLNQIKCTVQINGKFQIYPSFVDNSDYKTVKKTL